MALLHPVPGAGNDGVAGGNDVAARAVVLGEEHRLCGIVRFEAADEFDEAPAKP